LTEQLDIQKGLLALHAKKEARHTVFFERQLNRKQCETEELRVELNGTRGKLDEMAREYSIEERKLSVDQADLEIEKAKLSKSMARQVLKMNHLWNSVREIKAKAKAKALQHAASNEVKVSLTSCINLLASRFCCTMFYY
jgi:hypothetical protein